MTVDEQKNRLILVTGATGYVGGRLVPRLLEKGCRVRCLVRDPARLQGRPWQDQVEIVVGDVFQAARLASILEGVHAAYYLIHSMAGGKDFHERDLTAASSFAQAAHAAGVERIIYLGGLANASIDMSEHLLSRLQTGDALRSAGVPVTEFRAGVIVGSGSLSFEMIRYLTERLPVLIGPRWVFTRTQPIGIRDVLHYLVEALDVPESSGRIIEIGGGDIVAYGDMMQIYAQVRGLKRLLVRVPFLTLRLSSYWVNLVTPIPASIARPLIEGLRNENVVSEPSARQLFPQIQPASYRVSVERALARLQASNIESAWSDALSTSQSEVPPVFMTTQEGMVIEYRHLIVPAPAEVIFKVFSGIGGQRGWFHMNWAWRLRGFIDRLFGGVGLRRGRRDPDDIRIGDALDFWRVEAVEPARLLRLRAEMKVPGQAWLQFQVVPRPDGQSLLTQTAFFAPKGLFGLLYWYSLYPIHAVIFSGMIDQIAQRALRQPVQVEEETNLL
jgi:uncharacterized protein YbjT (DUF2867 family)